MIFDFNSPVSSWMDFCDCFALSLGWNPEPRTDPQKRDARLRDDGGERVRDIAFPPLTLHHGQIPKNATLDFEMTVVSACRPIMKATLEDSESNVTPKEVPPNLT